ncbi:DUF202 domain-containing protein [Wukongibacter baidiensis]|uniref:DUF202 domain-containing protein n=1 Tax=Wukongibacter baidiensis TaxID=1723361 RepID=UPI003D7F2396
MAIESNNEKIYDRNTNDLILRDFLALDRTILANERTLLAWIRTALSVMVAGVGFIKFFEMKIISTIGYGLVPTGLIIFIVGIYRFIKLQRKLPAKKA